MKVRLGWQICFMAFAVSKSLFASAPPFEWAKTIGSSGDDMPATVAADSGGNALAGGYFGKPGSIGGIAVTGSALAKITPAGNVLWAISIPTHDDPRNIAPGHYPALAVDPSDNIFVLNSYWGYSPSAVGPFLLKYAKDGTLLWSGGTAQTMINQLLCTDSEGNCFFAGSYQNLTYQTVVRSIQGQIVVKVAPNGDVIWSSALPFLLTPGQISVSPDGEVYVIGTNYGDGLLVKYDSQGVLLWQKKIAGDGWLDLTSVAAAGNGAWIAGNFTYSVDLGGIHYDASGTGSDGFVARLDASGNVLSSFRPGTAQLLNIFLDRAEKIVLAGRYNGTANLGGQTLSSSVSKGSDLFVARLNTNGTALWLTGTTGPGGERFGGLALSPDGATYLSGSDIDRIKAGANSLPNLGGIDGFIARLGPAEPVPVFTEQPRSQTVAAGDTVTLQAAIQGSLPLSFQWFFKDSALAQATNRILTLETVTLADGGPYFLEVTSSGGKVRSDIAELTITGQVSVVVTTLVGTNTAGYVDSTNRAEVRFHSPNGICLWTDGLIAVADALNHSIRLIDSQGVTVTYAGASGQGYLNGPAALARFNYPLGLSVVGSGDLLVADTENDVVRRISHVGLRNVSTVAGNGARGYLDGPVETAEFSFPNDVVADSTGNIFVTEFDSHVVRKITPSGQVVTLAGSGSPGFKDGRGRDALFNSPAGLTIDAQQNLYVTEWNNHAVRKISPEGDVTTFAGGNGPGFLNGPVRSASFNNPDGITIDDVGNLFLVEHGNHCVRKIAPNGTVSTVAGLGRPGLKDGGLGEALFNAPGGIMWHPSGDLFVADTENHSIRRVSFLRSTNTPGSELSITLNAAVSIRGTAGETYRIDAADETAPGTTSGWVSVATLTLDSTSTTWYDPQPATRKKRLYRAVKLP